MLFFKKKKEIFKVNIYRINKIKPPVAYPNCVHVHFSYWDLNGKKHNWDVCAFNNEKEIHESIINKIKNSGVSALELAVIETKKLDEELKGKEIEL